MNHRILTRLAAFAWGSVFASSVASAATPSQDPFASFFPNDPEFAQQWNLYSYIPFEHNAPISQFEQAIGSGVRADRAWGYHTGSPSTLIAVLDSGIMWDTPDLLERYFLNTRELPLPEHSETYDSNGDGRISVSDYQSDSRVADRNLNEVLDPGDLILSFSDGVDDDRNGFTDDISGWDFHESDNDPADRTSFGHGTFEAEDSAGAINNGIAGAGVCGNCSVVPIRVNDSFIVDANAFSQAVIYATDIGADLIQQALGSINHNPGTQEALNYSYDHGVVVIGTAADENSYHHNFPSTLDPVIYTNSIRHDSPGPNEATTFLNFNNCSNFGARVDVATPGLACSSEASGILSGVTSLALSYAAHEGVPLAPGETIALIKRTAIDINRGPNDKDPTRHSSFKGWDIISGYGRTDALGMMQAIKERRIPPEARITSPDWFALFRERKTADIPVTISAKTRSKGPMKITLAVAHGVETAGSMFQTVNEVTTTSNEFRGEIGRVSRALLQNLERSTLDPDRNRYAYTLRLTVDDLKGQISESRRTIFVFDDNNLLDAFPLKLPGSGESTGFFMDLNSDGRDEYVTADGGGWIHAFQADGSELKPFPVRTERSRYDSSQTHSTLSPLHASVVAPIAGGDLDGNGTMEIVAVSLEGSISVVNADGTARPGFPRLLPAPAWQTVGSKQILARGAFAAPTLVDLDQKAGLEIIVPSLDGKVYALHADGSDMAGFPVALKVAGQGAKLGSSPAVHDLNQDGFPDLVMGSNHTGNNAGYLFAIDGRGTAAGNDGVIPGFPTRLPVIYDQLLPTIGTGIPTSPVVADIDNDSTKEIIVHGFVGKTYVISSDGRLVRSLNMEVSPTHSTNDKHMVTAFGHPAVGDIDGDGVLDPVAVGAGKKILVALALGGRKYDFHHMVSAWNGASGAMIAGFPKPNDDMMIANSPALYDLNGDRKEDIIISSGGYFVHALTANAEIDGFPHFTGGWSMYAPSVGDIDGDGNVDIATSTREGYLFIWKTSGKTGAPGWQTFKGNPTRTGTR